MKSYDELAYKKKNLFEDLTDEKRAQVFAFADEYKTFLDAAKTEREAVDYAIRAAESAGFHPYAIGDKMKAGDKLYYNNHDKSVVLFRVGKDDIEKSGVRILASHIDSPRLDLKQNPLYEEDGMAFFKTHYYGGIKKYQWTTIPLALHGVVLLADGRRVTLSVGERDDDPVFYINDLLPHLGAKQAQEPLGTAITGETLNILVGGLPVADKDAENKIKYSVLAVLNEKYGMVEEDFISAELCLVPAAKARDVGFDRALIGAYGHDDRVCSYPALRAILEATSDRTLMTVLADKEEIGSLGVTGMQSDVLTDLIEEIALSLGKNPRAVRAASKCLSADVSAAYDPNFADVYEKKNAALLSCGTAMNKFTGARGKSGSSDASAEYVGFVRRLFAENGVDFQTAELGKVDVGGGGTVAMYIANHNIETVDLGVPVISMHAPYEVVSKIDLYTTYLAFRAFCL